MSHSLIRTKHLAVSGLIVGACLLAPLSVFAATTSGTSSNKPNYVASPTRSMSLSQAQQLVEGEVTARLNQLQKLQTRLNAAKNVTATDASTIQGILTFSVNGMNTVMGDVKSATTIAEVQKDHKTMISTYLIFAVVSPQTNLAIANDALNAHETKATTAQAKIQAALAKAQAKGKNVTAAQASFADFQTQVTNAGSALSGVSSSNLLSQNPAGYPGNKMDFTTAKTQLESARADLKAAAADVKNIRTDLKG